MTATVRSSRSTGASRPTIVAGVVVAIASLVVLTVASPDGVTPSRDDGAPTIPLAMVLAPTLIGIALALILSQHRPRPHIQVGRRKRLLATTICLVILAATFPLAVGVGGVNGEDYVLLKALLLIAMPAILVAVVRGSLSLTRPRTAWRWWAPLTVVLVWALGRGLTSSTPDYSGIDTATLLVSATATAITAGFGEEFFYRRLLQSRLEALIGPWAGTILASVAFAAMHLGSHSTGEPLTDIASALVVQGGFGLFMGVLWMRYRNFTVIVIAHVLANGWHDIVVRALLRSA